MSQDAQVHVTRWGSIGWLPYQALIGLLMVLSGVTRVVPEVEPLVPLSPSWLSVIVGVIYAGGGACILAGMWRQKIHIEVAGQVMLVVGTLIATAVGFIYHGPEVFTDFLAFIAVTWAAGTRLYQLARGRVTIQIETRTE